MTKTLGFIGLVIAKVERKAAEPPSLERRSSAGMGVLVFILALVTVIALTMATLFGSYCTK